MLTTSTTEEVDVHTQTSCEWHCRYLGPVSMLPAHIRMSAYVTFSSPSSRPSNTVAESKTGVYTVSLVTYFDNPCSSDNIPLSFN